MWGLGIRFQLAKITKDYFHFKKRGGEEQGAHAWSNGDGCNGGEIPSHCISITRDSGKNFDYVRK